MAGNAVIQLHHGLQQDVGKNNDVLRVLINLRIFNIHAPENTLFLSTNAQLAAATDTLRITVSVLDCTPQVRHDNLELR